MMPTHLAGRRHTLTVTAVDRLPTAYAQHCPAGLPPDALTAIAERRRTLVQHQPTTDGHSAVCDASGQTWPCTEYLTAAADQLDGRYPA